MTKRRKAANPIFSRPLTTNEQLAAEGKGIIPKAPRGNVITCEVCHKPGGTLIKRDTGYSHQVCQKGGKNGR